jgi:ribosomal protein S6
MQNNEELDIESVDVDDAEPRIYEVGYHIIPSVTEEGVSAEEASIKSVIEKNGGIVISGETPRLMELAYTIERVTESKREKFDTAYFGWVKFEIDPAQIAVLKEAFDTNRKILRSLMITTVRENTRSDVHPNLGRGERKAPTKAVSDEVVEEKAPVSEEELDRTIDELVVE